MKLKETHKYDDIINLSRPVSGAHAPMSMEDRAAQFSPFAALTGHSEAILETARLTDKRMDLDQDVIEEINEKLQIIAEDVRLGKTIGASITYFVEDTKKEGGTYVKKDCVVKKMDEFEGMLILEDGERIAVKEICEIDLEKGK